MVSCKYTKNTLIFVRENQSQIPSTFTVLWLKLFNSSMLLLLLFLLLLVYLQYQVKWVRSQAPVWIPSNNNHPSRRRYVYTINLCANIRIYTYVLTFVFMCLCVCVCVVHCRCINGSTSWPIRTHAKQPCWNWARSVRRTWHQCYGTVLAPHALCCRR